MGNETIQDTSFFNEKQEKQGKNWKNRGINTKKQEKKQEKTGKNRKLQEIQKGDFDEVPGNAENGKEFSARFREMLETETETRSSRMSRNNDSRAKMMYRPTPRRSSGGRDQFFENEAIRGEKWARNGKRDGIRDEKWARNGKQYRICDEKWA